MLDSSTRLRLVLLAVALIPFGTNVQPVRAAQTRHALIVPPSIYTYGGVVYDRLFSVLSRPRPAHGQMRRSSDLRVAALAGTPYDITDLDTIYEGNYGPLSAYPTAVNNLGQIAVFDGCDCFSLGDGQGSGGIVMDDLGDQFGYPLQGVCCPGGGASAAPNAINQAGDTAGSYYYMIEGEPAVVGNIAWGFGGGVYYFGGADNGSFAVAINDAAVSVGQDTGPKGVFASAYTPLPAGGSRRTLLRPPPRTAWIGTATGINDSGTIIGYATFPKQTAGRAVRFYENGYAAVLPVGAAGVSTSAQAINVHGDVVGNAGSQAFLYKNNRVTYLPRPPGEEAGNAVAFAINASDEILGEIINNQTTSAFLYVAGKSYDLNSLLPPGSGWEIQSASGINDYGQIVGNGFNAADPQGGAYSMKPHLPAAKPRTAR